MNLQLINAHQNNLPSNYKPLKPKITKTTIGDKGHIWGESFLSFGATNLKMNFMFIKAILQPLFLVFMVAIPEEKPSIALIGSILALVVNLGISLIELFGFVSRSNFNGIIGFILTAVLSEAAFWVWKILSFADWNSDGGKINTDLWWIDLIQIVLILAVSGISFMFKSGKYKDFIHAGYTWWYFPILKLIRFIIVAKLMGLIETHLMLILLPITIAVGIFSIPSVLLILRALIILVRFEFSQFKSFQFSYETILGIFTWGSVLVLFFGEENLDDPNSKVTVLIVGFILQILTLVYPTILLWRIVSTVNVGSDVRRQLAGDIRERAKQYAKSREDAQLNYPEQQKQGNEYLDDGQKQNMNYPQQEIQTGNNTKQLQNINYPVGNTTQTNQGRSSAIKSKLDYPEQTLKKKAGGFLNFIQIGPSLFHPAGGNMPPQNKTQFDDMCFICFANQPNTIIQFCNHGGICDECMDLIVEKKKECTLCRKKIDHVIVFDNSDGSMKEIRRI